MPGDCFCTISGFGNEGVWIIAFRVLEWLGLVLQGQKERVAVGACIATHAAPISIYHADDALAIMTVQAIVPP